MYEFVSNGMDQMAVYTDVDRSIDQIDAVGSIYRIDV